LVGETKGNPCKDYTKLPRPNLLNLGGEKRFIAKMRPWVFCSSTRGGNRMLDPGRSPGWTVQSLWPNVRAGEETKCLGGNGNEQGGRHGHDRVGPGRAGADEMKNRTLEEETTKQKMANLLPEHKKERDLI